VICTGRKFCVLSHFAEQRFHFSAYIRAGALDKRERPLQAMVPPTFINGAPAAAPRPIPPCVRQDRAQLGGNGLPISARRLAHRDAPGPRILAMPKRCHSRGAREQLFHLASSEFDALRDQQDLPLHRIARHGGFSAALTRALLRSVLVHHNQAVRVSATR